MGQYRQWLHCWEVDQQLDARLKELQQELMLLQEKAHTLKITSAPTDNVIIQALWRQYSAAQHLAQTDEPAYASMVPQTSTDFSSTAQEEAVAMLETMSQPALFIATQLFVQSNLPNFAPEEIPLSPPTATKHVAMRPQAANNLLPEDIVAFIDRLTHINQPQRHREKQLDVPTPFLPESGGNPIDQQSARTNQSIQRWAKRWGRTSNTAYEQQGSQTHER